MSRTRFLAPLAVALLASYLTISAPAAEATSFAGLWEDCSSVPGTCYGYRLAQTGERVCGSLSAAPLNGEGPREHGHIRGVVQGSLLTQVWVCGVESRSACPTIRFSNRHGLLRCGDEMVETGGRRYTCDEWAAQKLPSQHKRVDAAAFDKRFGPAPLSLCEAPVTPEAGSPPR
ncbi:MAG: hypothetical protein ABW190_17500 [Rhizobacter sp.]